MCPQQHGVRINMESELTWSQNSATYYKTVVEKECQTTGGVYLSNDDFEELSKKASFNPDFQNDLQKICV